jgi:hypothetical protein
MRAGGFLRVQWTIDADQRRKKKTRQQQWASPAPGPAAGGPTHCGLAGLAGLGRHVHSHGRDSYRFRADKESLGSRHLCFAAAVEAEFACPA